MDMSKCTQGPAQSGGCVVWQVNGDMICDLSANMTRGKTGEEVSANCELIAEAFTVASKTGLSPKQLAERIAELEAERDLWKGLHKQDLAELDLHRAKAEEDYWAWQGDEYDHLESLVCPIMIHPEQLRAIIANATNQKGE